MIEKVFMPVDRLKLGLDILGVNPKMPYEELIVEVDEACLQIELGEEAQRDVPEILAKCIWDGGDTITTPGGKQYFVIVEDGSITRLSSGQIK